MRARRREMHGREPTGAEVDEAWADASDFANWRLQLHPNAHIELLREMLPGIASQFFARGWTITRFERKALLTSDSPIYLAPHPELPAGMSTGLVKAGGILMTLDRRTALLMNNVGDRDLVMSPRRRLCTLRQWCDRVQRATGDLPSPRRVACSPSAAEACKLAAGVRILIMAQIFTAQAARGSPARGSPPRERAALDASGSLPAKDPR